jgi:hypothetical protein
MSFFQKKMSQNDWATILPFGPVTPIFYWPKKNFSGQPKAKEYYIFCIGSHLGYGSDLYDTIQNRDYHLSFLVKFEII